MKKIVMLVILAFPMSVLSAPVNINKADAQTISESLQGIGPKKAEAIVDYRKKNGSFKSVDDLSKVSGIGEKTLKANKKDILLK